MNARSDTLKFELPTADSKGFIARADAPFGCIAGDIAQMSAASLAAGAASARKVVALPLLLPAHYRPVRLRRQRP